MAKLLPSKFAYMQLTIALLLLNISMSGQLYSRLYHDPHLYNNDYPSMLLGSLQAKEESIYLTGVSVSITPPFYPKAAFLKLSANGDVDTMLFVNDTVSRGYGIVSNCLKIIADGSFIAIGGMGSPPEVFVMKFDSSLNSLLWFQVIDTPATIFNAKDIIETRDRGFLLAVNKSYQGNNKVLIYKTDSTGLPLNKKYYDRGAVEYPWVIRPMFNGHYMIGAVSYKASSTTPFWCRTWLIEVDSMGEMVREWLDPDPKNMWPYGMQQTADSGWIIVRQHLAYDVSNFQKYNAGIVKLTKDFTIEWEHYMGDSSDVTSFYDVEILPDGKYIACGTKPIWGTDSAHRYGWIVKFDTDGSVLWDRKYVSLERRGTHSFLYDIDLLPDGGFIACGELRLTQDIGITPVQQGWLLRVDSNGCVMDNCLVGIDEAQMSDEGGGIQVWPNPASGVVQIAPDAGLQGGEVQVLDIAGKVVQQYSANSRPLALDVSNFSKGIYVVAAFKGGRQARAKLVVQ